MVTDFYKSIIILVTILFFKKEGNLIPNLILHSYLKRRTPRNIIYNRVQLTSVGISELSRNVGPWAMPKDIYESNDGQTVK